MSDMEKSRRRIHLSGLVAARNKNCDPKRKKLALFFLRGDMTFINGMKGV